jgi:anti-sigma factor RsiW
MSPKDSHLSDQELLSAADGELPSARAEQVASHLADCWACRVRKGEIDAAIGDYVRAYRGNLDPLLPSAAGPRALLKAQLAQMTAETASAPRDWRARWLQPPNLRYAGAALFVVLLAALVYSLPTFHSRPIFPSRQALRVVPVSFPEPSLTPGVAAGMNRDQVCLLMPPKNRIVPASLQRKVFEEYGIAGAEPRAYEVDYLITPALGGADDIRNLWPQSNSSAVWNARVKDALEDRLHDLVCEGQLDLATAQQDISSDWIAAYKKYFHTDRPLP